MRINRGNENRHQTILEPKYFQRSFLEFLNLPNLASAVSAILTCEPSFSGLAVLTGASKPTLCGWHRDFYDDHPETPLLIKNHFNHSIQYNCALYEDQCLWIIPGSHKRETSKKEIEYLKSIQHIDNKYQEKNQVKKYLEVLSNMPNAINVKLEPGDCVLYNFLLWHAAMYLPEQKRATLHGGWKNPSLVEKFECLRWGLEHNPWFDDPKYLGDLGSYFGPSLEYFQTFKKTYVS